MYSLLFSDFPKGVENHYLEIKKYIKDSYKVAVLPWAFPVELDAEKFENEYFSKDTNRYQRYIGSLKKLNIMKMMKQKMFFALKEIFNSIKMMIKDVYYLLERRKVMQLLCVKLLLLSIV